MGPPPMRRPLSDGIEKPKGIRDVPLYLFRRIKGFVTRLSYIIGLVWKSAPFMLIALTFLCVFDGVLPVVGAYISRDLLNEISSLILNREALSMSEVDFNALSTFLFLLILNFVYLFLKKVMARLNGMVVSISGELVANHIRLMIVNKAKEVDMRSFDRPEFYEKLENANREAGMRPISILNSTFSIISSVLSSVSFIVVLVGISPYAPLIVILSAIPAAIVNYTYRRRNFRYMRKHSKERRQMNYYSSLMVDKDRAKEIRILGLSGTFINRYKEVFARYYKGLKKLYVKEGIAQIITALFSTALQCGLFLYIAWTIVFGEGQIGDYSLYTGALTSIAGYVTVVLTSTASIYEGTLFIDNMISFMNEDISVKPTGSVPLIPKKNVPHTVEFRNVSFAYPGTDRYVLKNVNLTFSPGESVVLVGLNGAGKTTLIKLLMRLYDVSEGVILLDGEDIRKYDVRALYDMFGIIFQEFGRYAETVSDNIAFGDIERSRNDENIRLAAEQGNSAGFIERLPDKYDTPLMRIFEENGIELSGGQWQKLSVSRAFYKDSEILILDEPTASLDPLAEQDVFNRFAELSKNKLSIFVSHRLSSAVGADKIVVISDGTVIESGTHKELMAKDGEYKKLFTVQASRYTGENDEKYNKSKNMRRSSPDKLQENMNLEIGYDEV